ncbi:MAG: HPr kinase/phosphatase C-terminal domain-containing protein [Methylocystis sp.]|uniref:HPr kinase/phosphorylase n=1 Tax=Methylocystis sp. TaxID=1911079 RepID=UPI0039415408
MTPPPQRPAYLHANALVLGEFGLLLRGPAGAGKSTLTLKLVADWRARGVFAALVGDDRVALEASHGRLIARPHPSIRGMIEARGLGVLRVDSEPACVVRAVIDLLALDQSPERFPDADQSRTELSGVILPRIFENAARVGAVTRIGAYIQALATN